MTYDYMSIESILALDCGSTTTQAILIDRVGGEYRMIARSEAPSTMGPPWNDVTASVLQALHRLSEVTGWTFLDGKGRIMTP
jgi:sugar (pentulose or hexulose) kinase